MTDHGPKLKHPQSRKRKKRILQGSKLIPPVTVCFVCQKDGNGVTVSCSRRFCAKIYHLACLNLPETPQGSICFVNHYICQVNGVKLAEI